jgi:hypothetical protein
MSICNWKHHKEHKEETYWQTRGTTNHFHLDARALWILLVVHPQGSTLFMIIGSPMNIILKWHIVVNIFGEVPNRQNLVLNLVSFFKPNAFHALQYNNDCIWCTLRFVHLCMRKHAGDDFLKASSQSSFVIVSTHNTTHLTLCLCWRSKLWVPR